MQSELEEDTKDFQKIILVGDASTGKTHIVYTFLRQKAPNNIMPTVAVQFSSKSLQLDNNKRAKVQIWDTAGQETYRSITMNYYRRVNGAFIVFDVSRKSTFEHVAYWIQNLREKGSPNIQIGLLGHKIDSSRREVSKLQAEKYAANHQIFYAQTTINDVSSINEAFKKLLTNIINAQNEDNSHGNIRLNHQANSQSSGCSC